jgi:hypothetical protein
MELVKNPFKIKKGSKILLDYDSEGEVVGIFKQTMFYSEADRLYKIKLSETKLLGHMADDEILTMTAFWYICLDVNKVYILTDAEFLGFQL